MPDTPLSAPEARRAALPEVAGSESQGEGAPGQPALVPLPDPAALTRWLTAAVESADARYSEGEAFAYREVMQWLADCPVVRADAREGRAELHKAITRVINYRQHVTGCE